MIIYNTHIIRGNFNKKFYKKFFMTLSIVDWRNIILYLGHLLFISLIFHYFEVFILFKFDEAYVTFGSLEIQGIIPLRSIYPQFYKRRKKALNV